MFLLNSLTFARLLWLVPIFFMLHNLEEVPSMESWSKRLPLKIHPHVSTRQIVIALTFLTLITLPFSFYLIRRALAENIRSWTQFWVLLGIAPFAMVIFTLLSLQIGKVFDK